MEEKIKELVELIEPHTEAIGSEAMVGIMDKIAEIKAMPDTLSADLAVAVADADTLRADLEAEKAAREAAAADYVKKLAKLLKGDIEDGDEVVEEKAEDEVAEDAYSLLF